ncbi:MAG: hypothetical protein O2857_28100 [Planctomycetota bacterium]|nr:hypothetical protein [Planctomycetota bacterium]
MILTYCIFPGLSLMSAMSSNVDIGTVKPDLKIPELSQTEPAPGIRVKQALESYRKTAIYHVLYLPTDWKPGKSYPVIVEYAGNGPYKNKYGDLSSGRVEGSKLGYGITEGRGFIWLCLPYLDGESKNNVRQWWGTPPERDPRPTVEYCKKAVPWICEKYGGDRSRVILCGFSRGAIACNFIGLWDEEIAGLWSGIIAYSHYDGVHPWPYPGADNESARRRLQRLGDTPQLICNEWTEKNSELERTRAFIRSTSVKGNFTFIETGYRNHNDGWTLRPGSARAKLRKWVSELLEDKN